MKRVKIMLMSLLLLAVVGGTLAFKAKFNTKYCTIAAVDDGTGNFTCPALGSGVFCADLVNHTVQQISGKPTISLCYTTTNGNNNCAARKDCRTFTTLTSDQ